MGFFINLFRNSIKLFIIQCKEDFFGMIYFPLMYAVAYCIGSIFFVVPVFNTFFRPFDIYWSINFAHWALSSSHDFFIVFKNSVRIAVSIIIGAIVSYASLSIVGKSVWSNCFILLVYVFCTTGPMMSSKLLPFSFGKFMFISYYFLTFTEINFRTSFYSPIIHLKFCLASLISILTCTITCILFRMKFGSGRFLDETLNIFHEIKSFIREAQFEMNLIVNNKFNKYNNRNHLQIRQHGGTGDGYGHSSASNSKLEYRNHRKNYFFINHINNHPHYFLNYNNITRFHPDHFKESDKQQQQRNHHHQQQINKYELKSKLDYHYYEYSRLLNSLNSYLNDCKNEFGNQSLVFHYEKVQILLERNHKKLFAIGFGLIQDLTIEKTNKLLPLMSLIDILVSETENIFNIMENQIKKKYIKNDNSEYSEWFQIQHDLNVADSENYQNYSDENLPFKIDDMNVILNLNLNNNNNINKDENVFKYNSLEWLQFEINQSFKRIDEIIKKLQDEFISIFPNRNLFDPNQDNSLTKVCFSVEGFISFSEEQKLLSKQIFLISYHLSLFRFRPREIRFITDMFGRFKNYFSKNQIKKRTENKLIKEKEDSMFKLNWSIFKKIQIFLKYIIFKRILYNWLFSLKYSIVIAASVVSVYEIQKHSNFILFQRANWAIDTFIVISHPDVGAIGFVSSTRIIGTMIGGFGAYTSVVLSKLGSTSVASAFIYIGFSFFVITFFSFLVQGQPFEHIIMITVFTYSIISVPQYLDRQEDVIYALFKIAHVTIGVLIVLLVALINPYFDYRQLSKNLYKIPDAIIDMVDFLLEYSFNINISNKSINNNSIENINNSSGGVKENSNLLSSPLLKIPENNLRNIVNNNNNNDRLNLENEFDELKNMKIENISFKHYRILIGKKYIKLRRIFPLQRQLLIDSGFELIFNFKKFNIIEDILYSIQDLHNLFGALEFMMIQTDYQSYIRTVGYLSKNENRALLDDLQNTSNLFSTLPPVNSSRKFTKKRSNELSLSIDNDNSIQLCNDLIKKINSIISNFNLPLVQFHRINAILYILHCFVEQYHLVYNKLIKFKDIKINYNNNNKNEQNHDTLNIKD